MSQSITIKNLGAISFARFTVPEEGGIVVLRGENGVGKSTALAAIHALTGGSDTLPVRDGEEMGEVVGLGMRLTVAKRRNLRGELSIESFSSDIDPGLLIDPGIKDAEAADLERARVLAALAGVGPDLLTFAGLFDGDLNAVRRMSSPSTIDAKSLPEMAKRLKLDIEVEARKSEEDAMKAEERVTVLRSSIAGVDLSAESDGAVLSRARELAVIEYAKIGERVAAFERGRAAEIDRRARLAALERDRNSGDVGNATAELARARDTVASLVEEQAQIEARLKIIAESLKGARESETIAARALASAESEERAIQELRRIPVDSEACPTENEVEAARKAAEDARADEAIGQTVRAALKAKAELDQEELSASRHRVIAEAFRVAAGAVWNAVAQAVSKVSPQGLSFRNGRIYVNTDRGEELFAELSDGERAFIAFAACIDATPKGGMMASKQEFFEKLDPENRKKVATLALDKQVTVFVGQADTGPLRAERFVG